MYLQKRKSDVAEESLLETFLQEADLMEIFFGKHGCL